MGDIFEGTPIFLEILKWKEREKSFRNIYFCVLTNDKSIGQSIWEWKKSTQKMVTVPREKLTENFSTCKAKLGSTRYNYSVIIPDF